MRESGVELAVGDSVQLDNHLLTVMDINGDEITFRLDRAGDGDPGLDDPFGLATRRLPR
jgi:hypothetical protein